MLAFELGPQGEGREWTASNTVTTLMRSYFIIDFTADINHMVLVEHINGAVLQRIKHYKQQLREWSGIR